MGTSSTYRVRRAHAAIGTGPARAPISCRGSSIHAPSKPGGHDQRPAAEGMVEASALKWPSKPGGAASWRNRCFNSLLTQSKHNHRLRSPRPASGGDLAEDDGGEDEQADGLVGLELGEAVLRVVLVEAGHLPGEVRRRRRPAPRRTATPSRRARRPAPAGQWHQRRTPKAKAWWPVPSFSAVDLTPISMSSSLSWWA